jgi:hypothetical protein
MSFEYVWKRSEANFGPPIEREVAHGTHISIENIPVYEGKFVALRRPQANPGHEIPRKAQDVGRPMLYFIHNLPLWGETLPVYVERVVRESAGVAVKNFRLLDLKMEVYPDTQQWAWTPYLLVELADLPVPGLYGNEVTEVVTFTRDEIPSDLGWWEPAEFRQFLGGVGL